MQTKAKASRRNNIKIKMEITEIENRKTGKKSIKPKHVSLKE